MSRICVVEKMISGDGDEGDLGQAHPDTRTVVIDPRQCSRDYLDTLVHECIHLMAADLHCHNCGEHQGDWGTRSGNKATAGSCLDPIVGNRPDMIPHHPECAHLNPAGSDQAAHNYRGVGNG